MATDKISNVFDTIGAIPAYASTDELIIRDKSDTTGDAGGTAKTGTIAGVFANAPASGNRFGTATTADALADTLLATSATTQKGLVIQAQATPTANLFEVQTSAGVVGTRIQSDLGFIVDQRTAATYANILDIKYQGTTVANFNSTGTLFTNVGFNGGGGFFITDASGNVTALGDYTGKHLIGNGTSPTVTGNGSSNGSVSGKDMAGKITVGTGTTTSIVLTFGTAYATAPSIVINAQTTTTAINVVTTTTTATLTTTAFTAGEVLCYVTAGF